MVIYADVLVSVNILVTYITLVSVRLFLKTPTRKWAVCLASILGGLSALSVIWDTAPFLSGIIKPISLMIIVAVGFLPKSPLIYVKAILVFTGINLLLGGLVLALSLTSRGYIFIYDTGTFYFDINLKTLLICVFGLYGVFLLCDFLITRHTLKGERFNVKIFFRHTAVSLTAFGDTGNSLRESFSGKPVIIAELKGIAPLFGYDELLYFKGERENPPQSLEKHIRIIPAKSIGGNSLLKAISPDKIVIKTNDGIFETAFCAVAIVDDSLKIDDCQCLLNKNIFTEGATH